MTDVKLIFYAFKKFLIAKTFINKQVEFFLIIIFKSILMNIGSYLINRVQS